MSTFPIRFTGLNKAMVVLGLTPRRSRVDVDETSVRVRMAWAFDLQVPRADVVDAQADTGTVWGWGVHGWRGVWLVNGSSGGLVRIELRQPVRARLMSIVPIKVRTVRVSVADPGGLLAALR